MNALLSLAAQLPTGLRDPRAAEKFRREREELAESLSAGDRLGALLEAADCRYYLVKAVHNGLMTEGDAEAALDEVCAASGFSRAQVEGAALAKYRLRAQPGNPKNDAAERAAAADLL